MCSALGLSVLGGCGKAVSAPSVGGETHWLQHCGSGEGEPGFDCGPGLECACGVCTAPCTDDASCSGAGDGAVCAERAATTHADDCESTAPEWLCVPASDVVLATAAAPAPVVGGDAYYNECGAGRVSTDRGCLTCAEVRSDLQLQRDALQLEYSACSSIDDCGSVSVGSNCDQSCSAAVNVQSSDAYSRHAAQLEQAYCKGQQQWYRECGIRRPSCSQNWTVCDTFAGHCVAIDASGPPCSQRSLDQCTTDDSCVIASGQAFDAAGKCFSAQPEAIRCVDRAVECPNEPTPAVDSAGNCYFLGDCIPNGLNAFRRAPSGHPCVAALGKTCGT